MTVNEESAFWTSFEEFGLWAPPHTLTTSSYGFLSLVWNTYTGLHRDMNSIQHLWDELGHRLRARPYHPSSVFDLTNAPVD